MALSVINEKTFLLFKVHSHTMHIMAYILRFLIESAKKKLKKINATHKNSTYV